MRPVFFLLTLVLGLIACGGEAPAGKATGGKGKAAPASPGAPGAPAGIELRRGREPRELVRIGTRGVVIGPAEGPLAWKFFAEPRRSDDAWYFLSTYAPFERKSPEGELVFRGHGRVKPGAVEQRMILEWARRVASDAAGGRGGAAYGLVLGWHRGASSGSCEDVTLSLTGEAVATGCGWDREIRGRLDPAQLGRVYGWFDGLQPFQAGGEQGEESLRPGSRETRLIFAGRGARPATAAEQTEIESFAVGLFTELASRRRGAAPQPAPAAPEAPQTGVPQTTAAAPAQRLLLPPNPAVKPRDEILLQLPDKPPPVPKPPPGQAPPADPR
jgi:hypothetical protein